MKPFCMMLALLVNDYQVQQGTNVISKSKTQSCYRLHTERTLTLYQQQEGLTLGTDTFSFSASLGNFDGQ